MNAPARIALLTLLAVRLAITAAICFGGPGNMPEPTGPLSKPKALLREMLALSPAFQEKVEAVHNVDAKQKIYRTQARAQDLEELRPFAVVTSEDINPEMVAGGSQNWFRMAGGLGLYLTDQHDGSETDIDEAATEFENWVGAIIVDLLDLAGKDTWLSIEGPIEYIEQPALTHVSGDAEHSWWDCQLAIPWR